MDGLMTRDLGRIKRQLLSEKHLYWITCEYVRVRHKVPYFSEKYVKKIWRFSKDVAESDAPKE